MNWDFSAIKNVGWIIPTIISLGILIVGIISLRRKPPQTVVNIIQKSNEPNTGIGLVVIGFILGVIVGTSLINDVNEEK